MTSLRALSAAFLALAVSISEVDPSAETVWRLG